MKEKNKPEKELFFPYYVNQSRLLDIYAILNDGYSEYSEITAASNTSNTKNGKGEASTNGGFKIFNFGWTGSFSVEKSEGESVEKKEKKVQTVTSVLSSVLNELTKKGYLVDICDSKPGQFVFLPVVLSINSIKSLLSEVSELLKLIQTLEKSGVEIKGSNKDVKSIDKALNGIQVLFDGEEILYETDNYAIIGNINDNNLYQAVRSDIIGSKMNCLGQVKRIYKDGTNLMKNTMFTKIKDRESKQSLIDFTKQLCSGDIFDFEATAVSSIEGKPVYQLEIIALFQ